MTHEVVKADDGRHSNHAIEKGDIPSGVGALRLIGLMGPIGLMGFIGPMGLMGLIGPISFKKSLRTRVQSNARGRLTSPLFDTEKPDLFG